MKWKSFRRAREHNQSGTDLIWLYFFGVGAGLFVPVLIVLMGLVIVLLLGPDAQPGDKIVFGTAIDSWFADWALSGDSDLRLKRLVQIVVFGFLLAAGHACFSLMSRLSAHWHAIQVVGRIMTSIQNQAVRLGPGDLLGGHRCQPEQLLADRCKLVQDGLIRWWLTVPRSIVMFGSLVVLSMIVKFWLTSLACLMAVGIQVLYQRLRLRAQSQHRLLAERVDAYHDALLEDLRLPLLTTNLSLDRKPGEPFADQLKRYQVVQWKTAKADTLVQPILILAVLFASLFLALVIGFNVLSDPPVLSVPGSLVLGAALMCAWLPARRILGLKGRLVDADDAAAEIFRFLDREPEVSQASDAKPLNRLGQSIRLDGVTLTDHSGRRILDGLSLTIPARKRIAILASDARTPLALAGLLLRFYDAESGNVLYDEENIRRATLDTVRGQSVLVSADGMVFSGTVTDNIACGDAFTSLQVSDAARWAGAFEFIQDLPQGFATIIGDQGTQLKTAQAFRIGLARALLREPSLLVIEELAESTNGEPTVDLESLLGKSTDTRTILVLPKRLASLRNADRVILLHEGKLHGEGSHAELLQSSELYRHINYVRYNAFRDKVS